MARLTRMARSRRGQYAFELVTTLILSLATVGSAYSAWRSSWWGSVQSYESGQAAYLQTESVRESNRHNTSVHVDVASWVAWLEAMSKGDTELAKFLASHFRQEFSTSFDAWMAGSPGGGRVGRDLVPEGSPFAPEFYRSSAWEQARIHQDASYQATNKSKRASEIATKFVLTVVIYASVLFMAGLSLKVKSVTAKLSMLLVATLLLVTAITISALIPSRYETEQAAERPV